jgi:hypothetical protein
MQLRLAADSMYQHTDAGKIKFVETYLEGKGRLTNSSGRTCGTTWRMMKFKTERARKVENYVSVKKPQEVFGDPEAPNKRPKNKASGGEYASRFNQIVSRLEWEPDTLAAFGGHGDEDRQSQS